MRHLRSPRQFAVLLAGLALLASPAAAQEHAHGGSSPAVAHNAALHMLMTPPRAATRADSARAAEVARTLRAALAPFRDTTAAVQAGYEMFAPRLKTQKVYHFTSKRRAVMEAFRFDPAEPTSLLYTKGADGRFTLVGAMYTAPKRFGPDKLDARVPLGVARWHRHVNWCIPKRGEASRWLERKDGAPRFGPESPVATKAECDALGGRFEENLFGWMVHANVMLGDDPATVWGDEHAGHDIHEGMSHDAMLAPPPR